jgi:hypothetical protein
MGQLAGLKRRKLALEMLGAAVQVGLDKRGGVQPRGKDTEVANQRSHGAENESSKGKDEDDGPATKKAKTDS